MCIYYLQNKFIYLLQWFAATVKYPGYAEYLPLICALLREQTKNDAEKKQRFVAVMKENETFVDPYEIALI